LAAGAANELECLDARRLQLDFSYFDPKFVAALGALVLSTLDLCS
jgi:hypothetical protein